MKLGSPDAISKEPGGPADALGHVGMSVEELESENERLRADSVRLDALELLIRSCPHTQFYFTDDPGEDAPVGFSITTSGCETVQHVGATLREAIDGEVEYQKDFGPP